MGRIVVAVATVLAALVLLMIGAIFGLNGDQWNWWQSAAFAGAALSLVVGVVVGSLGSRIASRLNRKRERAVLATAGFVGVLLLPASLIVMAERYSDPYAGPLFWPHTLAVLGLLGFALFIVSAAALSQSRFSRKFREHS